MNNVLSLTSGHKTLGIRWLIVCFASHQGSVSGDRVAAPKTPTFHTADRYQLLPQNFTVQIYFLKRKLFIIFVVKTSE